MEVAFAMTIKTEHVARSFSVFPAGSNGEFNLPEQLSTVVERGSGCEVWGVGGQHFLDFSMGWGSVLVGHAHPDVVAAVQRQAERGSNFAYVSEQSLELAEAICTLSPACDQVRFCASGTEATMYCQRLARAHTGRSKILKFEGAYHGANAVGVTSLFPKRLLPYPQPLASSAGIPAATIDEILVAPYNDLAAAQHIIDQWAPELAAVIVEPLQRCTPPKPHFLEGLRAATAAHAIALVFDEVVTGFRLSYGGAQEYYGVVPDLVAYGKALGGGYPIGAFGGRHEFMSLVREDRMGEHDDYVWTASSLGGNPVSASAALAALAVYRQPQVYAHLHDLGAYLRDGMRSTLARHQQPAQVIGDGPLAQVVFSPAPVFDYRTTQRGDAKRARDVVLSLFSKGIFLNPMGTKLYLSLAHSRDTCDEFLTRFDETLGEVKDG
jgi:glutamate-1-semialdehyde 2,1-aminomutase